MNKTQKNKIDGAMDLYKPKKYGQRALDMLKEKERAKEQDIFARTSSFPRTPTKVLGTEKKKVKGMNYFPQKDRKTNYLL